MYSHLRDAFHWWFLTESGIRKGGARMVIGMGLWGTALYELALGVGRWWEFVCSSLWWLPFFPVAIPALSLRAAPLVMMIVLVPLVLSGTDRSESVISILAASGVLALSLWAALPVIQYYVYMFLLLWF